MVAELWALDAPQAAAGLAGGDFSSEMLVRSCLQRIESREPSVHAWEHLDPDRALEEARAADAGRRSGASTGSLHGLPVGVKDIFDTRDWPTENGTVLHAGRQPAEDAQTVSLLRSAGAVIVGKTVTTELAVYSPGKTTNPHDPGRTPGGSSSGSAAAVAASMVPLALGSQTNGSVIRPASYCGIYGYKPTHGLISRYGVLAQSPPLDTIGGFARSITALAMLAEPLMAYDGRDLAMHARARPRLGDAVATEPPSRPRFAFVRSPAWSHAEESTKSRFETLADSLGESCERLELPENFDAGLDCHRTVLCADLAKSFAPLYERGREALSEVLREMIEEGQCTLAVDYNRALDRVTVLRADLDRALQGYDAIITPATTGEAPRGLESTGSPMFCTLWTLTGAPAVSLPLLRGESGMPIGVQLVGARHDDARLLRTARWLARELGEEV